MDPVDEIGKFAAFGAFVGALLAYLSWRLDDAERWAMHGIVGGGAGGGLWLLLGELQL